MKGEHMHIAKVAKAFGALVCACFLTILPISIISAFATDRTADAVYDKVDDNNAISAGTDLGIYGSVSQLRIAVPTRIALAINVADQTLAGPTPRTLPSKDAGTSQSGNRVRLGSGYGIENYSSFPVAIESIGGVSESKFSLNGWGWVNGDPSINNTTTNGNITDFMIRVENHEHPADVGGWDVLLPDGGSQDIPSNGKDDFTIASATSTEGALTPGIIGLNVHGFCTPIMAPVGVDAVSATDAFTITYTVKPA